jgi:hypothetical protein
LLQWAEFRIADGSESVPFSAIPEHNEGAIDVDPTDSDGEYTVVGTIDKVPDEQADESDAQDVLSEE